MKAIATALVLLLWGLTAKVYAAPTVFYNAHIHSSPSDRNVGSWIAVENGKVLQLGKNDSYRKLHPEKTIDLQGRWLMPGLTDSHVHIMEMGRELKSLDLKGTRSPEEVAARARAYLKANPGLKALVASGWDQSEWPGKSFSSRELLDKKVSSKIPVILYRVDGHMAWVNSVALNRSGLSVPQKDRVGGKIGRGASGKANGLLTDTAMKRLEAVIPQDSDEALEKYVELAVREAVSHGVTSAHDAGASLREIEAIRKALKSGRVRFRFYEMVSAKDPVDVDKALARGPEIGSESGQLTVRAVKLFADGAMGSRGAAFDAPYNDDPSTSGLLRLNPVTLIPELKKYQAKGFQVAVHAIGSRAVHVTLDAFQKALGTDLKTARARIEHAQVLLPEDVARFQKLGVIASMQPVHCTSDLKWVESRIGHRRAQLSYAWKSLLDEKAALAFGSDAPIESVNPWPGLFAAITRQTPSHEPVGGFFPEQKLSLEEALKAFTLGASYASFSEEELGSLSPGKRADFIVLSADPFTLSADEIRKTKVSATYIGGELVYKSPEPALIL